MELKRGEFCPLLKKDCIQLKCNWFIQIRGVNPNTGKEVDEWGCSIAWLPTLLINAANETRQGAAATESLRNEMVRSHESAMHTLMAVADLSTKSPAPTINLISDGKPES